MFSFLGMFLANLWFIGVVAFYLNVDGNCTYFIYWKHTLVFSWSSTKSFNLQFGAHQKGILCNKKIDAS